MKWQQKCYILILAVTIAAFVLRLPKLNLRPMHGDEAVHAVKFGELLERNYYRYDPNEYHGPTLNYLTLIPAQLSSADKFTDITEFTLRIVPVFFGVLLILLLLLLADGLGLSAAVCAAVFTAISSAFVFYSRYYIQETLLVCFTFAVITFGYRYTRSKNIGWALLTGVFLGLMHATKETSIIAFSSMLLALLLTFLTGKSKLAKYDIRYCHLIAAIVVAVLVSVLFYSSFFTNPAGILDSVRTYSTYLTRAGQDQLHVHPWYYYLKILICFKVADGPVWSEALIVLLAVVGFVVAMTKKGIAGVNFHLLRFIAFYTVLMTVVYSVIPYKTPWSMLGFLHGMILLAGLGAAVLIKLSPNVLIRMLVGLILIVGGVHLAWQSYQASFKYYANPANPYVYAHPLDDVVTVAERVKQIAQVHPDGNNMYIQVICPDDDYWPLPWYLRSLSNVGWQDKVAPSLPAAPVIIASPSVESALMRKLYELPPPGEKSLYVPLFDTYTQLRPQVELRGYVIKELWDEYRRQK